MRIILTIGCLASCFLFSARAQEFRYDDLLTDNPPSQALNSELPLAETQIGKIIANGIWEWHSRRSDLWHSFSVRFKDDMTLEVVNPTYGFSENLTVFRAHFWVVDDKTIILRYIMFSGYDAESEKSSYRPKIIEMKGTLSPLSDSVHFRMAVAFNRGITLFGSSFPVLAGENRSVGGVPVVTLGVKNSMTTDNVRIRVRPSISASSIKYNEGMEEPVFDYYPKNKSILLLARTLKKEKVGKWNNYWYYAQIYNADGIRYGWVFGEFVDEHSSEE